MSLFDDNVEARVTKSPQSANNCDIFEPSVYAPEDAKYRTNYVKRITAKVTAEMDTEHLAEEAPNDKEPKGYLEVTGKDPEKHLKFVFEYLRGPRGFNGSVDNFVVLSEAEYDRLKVKDPNKFYFTYESESTPAQIEDGVLITQDTIENHILITSNSIENKILIL